MLSQVIQQTYAYALPFTTSWLEQRRWYYSTSQDESVLLQNLKKTQKQIQSCIYGSLILFALLLSVPQQNRKESKKLGVWHFITEKALFLKGSFHFFRLPALKINK